MMFFGVCFFLYFIKLSAGNGLLLSSASGEPRGTTKYIA